MQNPKSAILYTKILSVVAWFALIAQFGIRSFIGIGFGSRTFLWILSVSVYRRVTIWLSGRDDQLRWDYVAFCNVLFAFYRHRENQKS